MANRQGIDSEIAAFHRAGRRRKAIAFAITAAFAILGGLAAILVGYLGVDDASSRTGTKMGLYVMIFGAGGILVGLIAAGTSYRLARGQIDDAEY